MWSVHCLNLFEVLASKNWSGYLILVHFNLYPISKAFKLDWRQQYIGAVEDAVMYTASKTKDILIVRTVLNILAGKLIYNKYVCCIVMGAVQLDIESGICIVCLFSVEHVHLHLVVVALKTKNKKIWVNVWSAMEPCTVVV